MKKLIINFFLLILIFLITPDFIKAQVFVPVVDPNVVGGLDKVSMDLNTLLVTIGESFKQTNNFLSKILETQFQQIANFNK